MNIYLNLFKVGNYFQLKYSTLMEDLSNVVYKEVLLATELLSKFITYKHNILKKAYK